MNSDNSQVVHTIVGVGRLYVSASYSKIVGNESVSGSVIGYQNEKGTWNKTLTYDLHLA